MFLKMKLMSLTFRKKSVPIERERNCGELIKIKRFLMKVVKRLIIAAISMITIFCILVSGIISMSAYKKSQVEDDGDMEFIMIGKYTFGTLSSGSMEPDIMTDEFVLFKDQPEYYIGDVVLVRYHKVDGDGVPQYDQNGNKIWVTYTHEIVMKEKVDREFIVEGEKQIVKVLEYNTRGVANGKEGNYDGIITGEQILGKVIWHKVWIGNIILAMEKHPILIIVADLSVFAIVMLILVYFSRKAVLSYKEKFKENTQSMEEFIKSGCKKKIKLIK